ncbi:MAG: dihydroorotate dehydrogenase [Candidatus Korarchaeota archaeon]|nr:dihydroorotate dehydrogenase [Candidatus Korarchaeota archaeon]
MRTEGGARAEAQPSERSASERVLGVELAGLRLANPTILASGVLGTSASLLARSASSGAGAVTTKTITPHPKRGNPNPVVVELDVGLLNSMGLPNPGLESFLPEIRAYRSLNLRSPLIVSIWALNPEEASIMASKIQQAGASAVELNVSCPNTPQGEMNVVKSEQLVRGLIKAIRHSVSVPIFVKLPPLHWGLTKLAGAAVDAGADVLVATNTLRGMALDVRARRPILSGITGGLSGRALKPVALRAVYELYGEFGDEIQVGGVGGVQDWRDAVEYLLAGASAVEIGTALLYRGLSVFRRVASGIEGYLREEGFHSVEEIVGAAHRR